GQPRGSGRAAVERTKMAGKSFTVATSEVQGDLAVDRAGNLGRRGIDQFRREFEVPAVEQVLPDKRQLDAVGRPPAEPRIEGEIAVDAALGQVRHVAPPEVELPVVGDV